MELRNVRKGQLQHMEHYQFADRVLTLCKEAKTEKLTAVLGPLEAAVAEEDKALNQPRTEPNTQKMREADERRDRSYQALRLAVALHLHSTDAATLAAAEAVNRVMEAYPNVTASNYDKETGLIRNLVADLGTDDVAQHVTKIDADLYVNRLEMDNTVFDKLFHAQLKTGVTAGAFDVKQLRAATDRALSAVLRRVEALDELEPSAPIASLITQYNNLVDNRRTLLAHRAGTSQTARDRRRAEHEAHLRPGFAALEQQLGLTAGSLSFTGKTEGTGAKRHYELAMAGQTTPDGQPKTIWVGQNKNGSLFVYEKVEG